MTARELEHLKQMANQIAANFSFHADQVDRIADHLTRFWAPSMRRMLKEHIARGAEGLEQPVIEAVARIDVATRPIGAILAGGQSSRMGMPAKAVAPLGGLAMIRHALQRLEPQTSSVMISVQDCSPVFEGLGYTLVTDLLQSNRGPLVGLYSALQRLVDDGLGDWLLLCPCDAPFLPADLGERLHLAAIKAGKPVSVVEYEEVVHPTFSLWNAQVLPVIRDSITARGRGGLRHVLLDLPHTVVPWPSMEVSPFFNVNTPEDLALAERLLDRQTGGG